MKPDAQTKASEVKKERKKENIQKTWSEHIHQDLLLGRCRDNALGE